MSERQGSGAGQNALVLVGLGLVIALTGGIWGLVHLAAAFGGPRPPASPPQDVVDLLTGRLAWDTATTVALIVIVLALLLLISLPLLLLHRRRRKGTRVDKRARRMARRQDVASTSMATQKAKAQRLGMDTAGHTIGYRVSGGAAVVAGWEDCLVDISGPRTGKTTSRAIPLVIGAPGAVVATSNKRDLVDATRDPRTEAGQVWVFDLQGIVGEPRTWWWNPLSYVTDEVQADQLAKIFASSTRDAGARTDAYFDTAAVQVLGLLLLAAALADRPITDVYLWLLSPTDPSPTHILGEHSRYTLQHRSLRGYTQLPDKQRDGVFGTAATMAAVLANNTAASWVVPPTGLDKLTEFDPSAFALSHDTLYALSREGKGSTAPLVTALTAAVTEAAEEAARGQSQGRLGRPMTVVLDEAANVCRWAELPNMYSHFGSRGICVDTILQSWSQGVEVWGREGMRKLWSAATVKIYGGGVSETEFLGELSQLVGKIDETRVSVSSGQSGRSTSRSTEQRSLLEVSDLGAMPVGRALVIASGSKPQLIRTVSWTDRPGADRIRASIQRHDPGAATTIAHAEQEAETEKDTAGVDPAPPPTSPAPQQDNPWMPTPPRPGSPVTADYGLPPQAPPVG